MNPLQEPGIKGPITGYFGACAFLSKVPGICPLVSGCNPGAGSGRCAGSPCTKSRFCYGEEIAAVSHFPWIPAGPLLVVKFNLSRYFANKTKLKPQMCALPLFSPTRSKITTKASKKFKSPCIKSPAQMCGHPVMSSTWTAKKTKTKKTKQNTISLLQLKLLTSYLKVVLLLRPNLICLFVPHVGDVQKVKLNFVSYGLYI